MKNSFLKRLRASGYTVAGFNIKASDPEHILAFVPTLNDKELISVINKRLKFSGKPTSGSGDSKFALFPCNHITVQDIINLQHDLAQQGWEVLSLTKFKSMGMDCISLSMACNLSADLHLNLVQINSDVDVVRLQTLKSFK